MNNANKEITALVRASNSGAKIPAMQLIEQSPSMASIMSKLNNPSKDVKFDADGNRTITAPNRNGLADISHDVAQKSTDNENTLQLFPELEQGLRILVNATMSPKDMNSTEINFSVPTDLKVSPLTTKLLPIVEEALSKDFKLKEELPDILYRVLAVNGSDPYLIIPESVVDDMINDRKTVSTESIKEHFGDGRNFIRGLGLLGNSNFAEEGKEKPKSEIGAGNFAFESFVSGEYAGRHSLTDSRLMFKAPRFSDAKTKTPSNRADVDTLIRVTDNIDMIKLPELIKIKREHDVNKALAGKFRGSIHANNQDIVNSLNIANENIRQGLNGDINNPGATYGSSELNDVQLTQLLYKTNPNIRNVTRKVKTSNETSRYNIGKPLVKRLPPEAVIPVCRANDLEDHVAYYVLMDGMGNALSKDSATSAFEDFRRNQRGFQSNNNLSSYMMQKTADAFNTSCDQVTYQQMQKVCTDIIETDLLARMRNGVFGDDVALVAPDIVYDIMLARMFREQQTQVLFVPAELMTYYHFKLRKNGTGKTLLEDSMVTNTLRAVLMFANVNRAVINSMGRTEIELNVDELDPNKPKTLEIAKHEALKFRQSQALPATISPTDINVWLKTAGINFKIPSVPGLPNTSVNITETASSYTKPDTDLMDALDKKAYNGIGVPPELVNNSNEVEFATNILANNIRLNKYVLQLQDAFTPEVNKFSRTFCMNHGDVVKRVEDTIRENIALLTEIKEPDEFITTYSSQPDFLVKILAREFLSNFEFSFSRPDSVTLKNQLTALQEYIDGITTAVKHYLSEDILSAATSGEITAAQVALVQNSCISHYVREYLKKNAILPELFEIVKIDEHGKSTITLGSQIAAHAATMTQFATEFLKKTIPISQAADRDMEKVSSGEPPTDGPSASAGGGGSFDTGSSTTTSEDDDSSSDDTGGEDDLLADMPSMDDL